MNTMRLSRLHSAWLATSLVLGSIDGAVAQDGSANVKTDGRPVGASIGVLHANRLSAESTIGDLLNHPAFAEYATLLMPWDDRAYDETMRLREFGALLPYHSHVDPGSVVAGLNRMIDDVAKGRPVFYDIYTDAQKRADPSKEKTGLFFFRGKPGAPFAIVSPGGGFSYVGSVHEGFPYAAEISDKGYNVFALKYRVGRGGAIATQDLAAAISTIFRNAEALGVGTQNYSLWGSSAGARMAAAIGSHGVAAFGGDDFPKPAAVVMAYTAHSNISPDEPPTFVIVGEEDGIAPPSVMARRVEALRQAGTHVEFRRYQGLGHGFGLGVGTAADGWITEATRFWEASANNGN